ncbi:MAG: UDP-glucose/GDP-mannose dehydrogenase family protein, partial [Candidatus Omnitrophica bacterium]|nr:UDP-glucose/GDP-mannose dehydrogenase family protein [Candidatus Omnitrophota bacterium]
MNITIIGSGYVGLVTGTCFAELGNKVICVDNDAQKIRHLKTGHVPIYEPGLEDLIKKNVRKKRLFFNSDLKSAVKKAEVIFITVGTPAKGNGEADLTGIENVARNIAHCMTGYKLIVEKSTVPVETGEWVKRTIEIHNHKKHKFDVASNPEFLREGQAINDFMHPDRIVLGVESNKAKNILTSLYRPLKAPILITDIKSAELIKHASNSFLAAKISFINAVSEVCERVGADVTRVAQGMGMDKRINELFLDAGVGYGGSCFPKDIDAFVTISEKLGYDFGLLKEVREINLAQKHNFIKKIEDNLWIIKNKTIAVLGLAFKPNTDDIRSAPAIDIIKRLEAEGAKIKVYDPCAMPKAREVLKGIKFCKDPYDAARESDCLIIVTEWNEFKELDLVRMKKCLKRPLIIDGRNIYEPQQMKKLGYKYISMGR